MIFYRTYMIFYEGYIPQSNQSDHSICTSDGMCSKLMYMYPILAIVVHTSNLHENLMRAIKDFCVYASAKEEVQGCCSKIRLLYQTVIM